MIATKSDRVAGRWIPEGSTPISNAHGVVYMRDTPRGPVALAYRGTAAKPSWHYSFKTREQAEKHAADWLASLEQAHAAKEAERAKRRAFVPDLQVGDVLYGSWGYDQTNPEFWQVVELRGRMVTIREIAVESVSCEGQSSMSDRVRPIPGQFVGEPVRKLVQVGNVVKLYDFGCYLSKWDRGADGSAYRSWYA